MKRTRSIAPGRRQRHAAAMRSRVAPLVLAACLLVGCGTERGDKHVGDCPAGGAIINVVFSAEPATRRITALFKPERLLRQGAESVGAARGLGKRWLAETVRRYVGPGVDADTFLEQSNLRVYAGRPEYLLAMRCAALRLGEESESRVDIRYLLRYLNLSTADEALGVVDRYFGERQLPADIRETLDRLLSS